MEKITRTARNSGLESVLDEYCKEAEGTVSDGLSAAFTDASKKLDRDVQCDFVADPVRFLQNMISGLNEPQHLLELINAHATASKFVSEQHDANNRDLAARLYGEVANVNKTPPASK